LKRSNNINQPILSIDLQQIATGNLLLFQVILNNDKITTLKAVKM